MSKEVEILIRFGRRVRQLRNSTGLSQESFADKCKMDRTYVGGIERGQRNVALRNIEAIATAFEITLSELMDGL